MSLLSDATGLGDITTLASLGLGIGQLISGEVQSKKAAQLSPQSTDPQEQEFYNTILNLNKTTRTGAAYNTALKQIKELASEGDRGGASSAAELEGHQTSYDKALNAYGEVLGNSETKQAQLLGLQDTVLDRMASRRADLQLMQYSQGQQDARSQKQAGFSNIVGALASATKGISSKDASTDGGNTDNSSDNSGGGIIPRDEIGYYMPGITNPDGTINKQYIFSGPDWEKKQNSLMTMSNGDQNPDNIANYFINLKKTSFGLDPDGLSLYNDSLNQ